MFPIYKKEISQFFSSLTSHLAMGVFLLLMGLFLFIFPETSILDYGYATLDKFFELAPYILLLLTPAITMRSFSDEFRGGTWELLKTKPVSLSQIIIGKYFAALSVALLALVPTLIYVYTIKILSINGSIDAGGIAGSYFIDCPFYSNRHLLLGYHLQRSSSIFIERLCLLYCLYGVWCGKPHTGSTGWRRLLGRKFWCRHALSKHEPWPG